MLVASPASSTLLVPAGVISIDTVATAGCRGNGLFGSPAEKVKESLPE